MGARRRKQAPEAQDADLVEHRRALDALQAAIDQSMVDGDPERQGEAIKHAQARVDAAHTRLRQKAPERE